MATDDLGHDYATEELRTKLFAGTGEPFVLVDTLPHEAYEFRHLPGAISLPLELLEELAPETLLDRDVEIITYCTSPSCPRSKQAVRLLRRLGYRRLAHYSGGLAEWRKANLPFDKGHDRSVRPEEFEPAVPPSAPGG